MRCFCADEKSLVSIRDPPSELAPTAIDSLSSAVLIAACQGTHSLYAIHASSGQLDLLGEGDELHHPSGLVVVERDRRVYIADTSHHQIRSAVLPAHLFHK